MVSVANRLKRKWKKILSSFWRCHSNSSVEGLGKFMKNLGTALFRARPPERESTNADDAMATFRTIQAFTRTHRGTQDTSVRLPISRLLFVRRTSGMQDCWRHSSPLRPEMLACPCILTSLRRTEENNSWGMKNQLDVTCYFTSLIMRSTCFGH